MLLNIFLVSSSADTVLSTANLSLFILRLDFCFFQLYCISGPLFLVQKSIFSLSPPVLSFFSLSKLVPIYDPHNHLP